jgi:hypothetical protein
MSENEALAKENEYIKEESRAFKECQMKNPSI